MSFLAVLLLSLAMSTDAFAVAVCKGVNVKVTHFFDALKIGLLFGVIEAITPLLGWLIGYFALPYIEQWDHWVIFFLMSFLGLRMMYCSFKSEDDECGQGAKQELALNKQSLWVLILTAITTSIDALVVGAGLALASVNIGFAATMIGLATCIMVTIGILLGKHIGCMIGKKAECLGGGVLIAIGAITLYQHII